jgi:hypothetical protein
MKRKFIAFFAALTLLASCERYSHVDGIGADKFKFVELRIERLPRNGEGRLEYTYDHLDFSWSGHFLRITDNKDGTYTVSSPAVAEFEISSEDLLTFDDDGTPSIVPEN